MLSETALKYAKQGSGRPSRTQREPCKTKDAHDRNP